MNNNSEVDINLLVSIYNQKISTLTNQNILLEAKLQTLIKDYEEEKNSLLMKIIDLTDNKKSTKNKLKEDYQESDVE